MIYMAMIDTESESGKAELQKIVDAATEGLRNKNSELLGDIRKNKDAVKSLQDQLDELKKAREDAESEAAAKSGDVEKVKADYEKKLKKESDARAATESALNGLLVENGLTEALSKAGVAPQYMDGAKSLIQRNNKIEVVTTDGKATAKIGNDSISEFVSKWSQSDDGKHYVAAPQNGGGGANGANGGGKAPTGKKKADMSVSEKTAFIRENGKEAYDKLS